MGIGPLEIGIVLVLLLVLFGAKKLPELGKGLGSGMREFKEGVTGDDKKSSAALNAGSAPAQAPAPQQAQPITPDTAPAAHPDPDAPASAPRHED